jgi:hypothetical protein
MATALQTLGGSQLVAAIAAVTPGSGTYFVHAGIPFTVNDGNGTQICISSRSGRSLPPFVVPSSDPRFSITTYGRAINVQADVPFVIHDSNGTQLCVSTRAGRSVPPFVIP